MRVAIYTRVSTEMQALDKCSLSVQAEKLEAYCKARDWSIVKEYVDPGFSGSNMDRPGLKKMLSDISAGNIDMVLVYKLDRLSRSQRDTLYMIEDLFLKNNVDFVSMTENFDTSTPLGRAMIGILSVFAQLEREQIKERMAMGNVARAASGLWRGGSGAPIGYDYVDGKLEVNDYEAMQARLAFDLFLKGYTYHGISTEMQKRGYTNKYGSWKYPNIIPKVLTNPVYIGKVRYAGEEYEGKHEPIIDMDTWNAVQIRYKEVTKGLSDNQKSGFKAKKLLSGFMWCSECGARYFFHNCVRKNVKGERVYYNYYQCYTRAAHKRMRRADRCPNISWKQDVLDNLIIAEIKKLSFDPNIIDSMVNESKLKSNDELAMRSKAITDRITEIDKQTSKLMDLYTVGSIPIDVISEKANALNNERCLLEEELDSIQPDEPVLSISDAKRIAKTACEVFEHGSFEEQRQLVDALIERIELGKGGNIDIYWKFS